MPIPMSRSGVCGLVKGGGPMLIVGGAGSTAASAAQTGLSGVLCSSSIDLAERVALVARCGRWPSVASRRVPCRGRVARLLVRRGRRWR